MREDIDEVRERETERDKERERQREGEEGKQNFSPKYHRNVYLFTVYTNPLV